MLRKLEDIKHRNAYIPDGLQIAPWKSSFPLERAIEVYELVKEYKDLEEDYQKCSSSARPLIEKQLNELERKLNEFYIVTNKELIEKEMSEK